MSTLHAVVNIDHQTAQVLQFDAEHVAASPVKAHEHHTAQHGSEVRLVALARKYFPAHDRMAGRPTPI